MRHAGPGLRAKLEALSETQRRAILEAQRAGWRPDEDPEVLLAQVVALTAGASLLFADPLYREVFGGLRGRPELEAVLRLLDD